MESVKEYIITRLVTYNTSPFLLYFPLLPTFGRINVQDLQFPCLWLKFPLCVKFCLPRKIITLNLKNFEGLRPL